MGRVYEDTPLLSRLNAGDWRCLHDQGLTCWGNAVNVKPVAQRLYDVHGELDNGA